MLSAQKRRGYLVAVLASGLVLLLRFVLHHAIGENAVYLPFVLAVTVASWRGGFGPGLLATVLSLLLALIFLAPPPLQIESLRRISTRCCFW